MKNTNIAIIVLVVLALGAVLIFGTGRKAQAPVGNMGDTTMPMNNNNQVACTMEAKLCPDGSYVGRSGPTCEFAACPIVTKDQAVKEFTVTGQNFSFAPSLITVNKGDKVKITFKNVSGFHNFVIDQFGVATAKTQSPDTEVLEFTANKTGSFEYYCAVGSHRAMGMKGTLVVK